MTNRQVPPEGTVIWVWIRAGWRQMGVGPVECRVGKHWPDRHVQAHAVSCKEWVWLDDSTIFAESLEECVRLGLEAETESLNRLKGDYDRRVAWIAELRDKWA